jgi:hypothetical protein
MQAIFDVGRAKKYGFYIQAQHWMSNTEAGGGQFCPETEKLRSEIEFSLFTLCPEATEVTTHFCSQSLLQRPTRNW